ncbi:MAG: hypothetical protein GY811_19125 [Myxococcales bacterium]|nr:hypothetical protein [Myxococcales bacterium]
MKRTGLLLLSAVAAFGCQRDDAPLTKQVEDLKKGQDKILAAIEKMPKGGAAAARPQRPRRPSPDANSVYSVNIAGSPYKGAKDAKVTIVEAFEFA